MQSHKRKSGSNGTDTAAVATSTSTTITKKLRTLSDLKDQKTSGENSSQDSLGSQSQSASSSSQSQSSSQESTVDDDAKTVAVENLELFVGMYSEEKDNITLSTGVAMILEKLVQKKKIDNVYAIQDDDANFKNLLKAILLFSQSTENYLYLTVCLDYGIELHHHAWYLEKRQNKLYIVLIDSMNDATPFIKLDYLKAFIKHVMKKLDPAFLNNVVFCTNITHLQSDACCHVYAIKNLRKIVTFPRENFLDAILGKYKDKTENHTAGFSIVFFDLPESFLTLMQSARRMRDYIQKRKLDTAAAYQCYNRMFKIRPKKYDITTPGFKEEKEIITDEKEIQSIPKNFLKLKNNTGLYFASKYEDFILTLNQTYSDDALNLFISARLFFNVQLDTKTKKLIPKPIPERKRFVYHPETAHFTLHPFKMPFNPNYSPLHPPHRPTQEFNVALK